jgi:GDPmannose 4,6-dehydratase
VTGVALVTGVTGQDGSYLVERLIGEGWEVHGSIHEGPGVPRADIHLHSVDLTDFAAARALVDEVQPHEIYNLAAISSVAQSWSEPVATALLNGVAAVAIMDAALELQDRAGRAVRLVQASSAEIFGEPDRSPQTEETPLRPISPYGTAKAYAHMSAGVYRSRGLHVASCILYNHESPRRPERFVTRKITAAAARIASGLQREPLSLGNLGARRDWGWAPDYVDAMVRAARHTSADDFVVATGETHSVRDFVEAAFVHAGLVDWQSHVTVDEAFERPRDPSEQVGDARKARTHLQWVPTKSFTEVVHAMVDHDLALLQGGDVSRPEA